MATAAQIEANRKNAQSSTGPRTEAGKRASSANATKFGLFSAHNCIQPEEQKEYDEMSAGLFEEYSPVGHIEHMLTTEIVRAVWRLRRCAHAEASLGIWNRKERNKENKAEGKPEVSPADAVCYDYTASIQAAIDSARGQAYNIRRRAEADLANRQTERLLRLEVLPAEVDPAAFGVASIRQILAGITRAMGVHLKTALLQEQEESARLTEELRLSRKNEANNTQADDSEKQSQSSAEPDTAIQRPAKPTPRNAPCACNSGLKFKRCCGRGAPPVLAAAA